MADHYSEFNVGIMCLIPSHHRAGLVRKLFHYSETLFFCCVEVYEEVGELAHTYKVFHRKKKKAMGLPFLRKSKITPENLLSSLLSENKP